jgi:hypothetical protein
MHSQKDNPPKDMEALYLRKIRGMNGEQRLEIAAEISEAVKELAIAGIRHNYPGISDDEIKAELHKRIYG